METGCVARVVCIEDEPDMIELMRLLLSRQGFEVVGARGGKDGLEKVEQTLPELVLLDIMMPDMDGWEVYNRLKANPKTRNIPVIVVTARAQTVEKLAALREAGVDEYITKPFGPGQLLESIERVLGRKR
jgi:two-component system, OmpR family, response regulator VicR